MNKNAIMAIAKKDIKGITTNTQIWLPMLIVPVIMIVVFPTIFSLLARFMDLSQLQGSEDIKKILSTLPVGKLQSTLLSLPTLNQQFLYLIVNYLFMPFFLIVPAMSASIIAANSFVSEKEGRTLESLLFAPIDIRSLFLGKALSALLPTLFLTLLCFLLYGILVNTIAYPLFHELIFPTGNWWVLLFWVIPLISVGCILLNVLVSARVKTFQAANQISGMVVLPIILLVAGQFSGLLLLNSWILFLIGVLLLVLNVFFLRRITRLNNRNTLFESQIH